MYLCDNNNITRSSWTLAQILPNLLRHIFGSASRKLYNTVFETFYCSFNTSYLWNSVATEVKKKCLKTVGGTSGYPEDWTRNFRLCKCFSRAARWISQSYFERLHFRDISFCQSLLYFIVWQNYKSACDRHIYTWFIREVLVW